MLEFFRSQCRGAACPLHLTVIMPTIAGLPFRLDICHALRKEMCGSDGGGAEHMNPARGHKRYSEELTARCRNDTEQINHVLSDVGLIIAGLCHDGCGIVHNILRDVTPAMLP